MVGGGGDQAQNQKHHGEAGSGDRCEASLQGALRGRGNSQVQSTSRVWGEQRNNGGLNEGMDPPAALGVD